MRNDMLVLTSTNDELARNYADEKGWKICNSGAMLANLYGFSTQVVAKEYYLIDGDSCDVEAETTIHSWNGNEWEATKDKRKINIHFRKAEVPFLNNVQHKLNHIIQILHYMGEDSLYLDVLKKVDVQLNDVITRGVDFTGVPQWITTLITTREPETFKGTATEYNDYLRYLQLTRAYKTIKRCGTGKPLWDTQVVTKRHSLSLINKRVYDD